MVDFAKKLKDLRTQQALEKQLAKVKKDTAPSMNVTAGRKKKEEEPPPPDITELDLPPAEAKRLAGLIEQHASISRTQSTLNKQKKVLTEEEIKPLCKIYKLDKFMANGSKASYYKTTRTSISMTLLLANNVPPDIIAKSTVTKEVWQFKATPPGMKDEEEQWD